MKPVDDKICVFIFHKSEIQPWFDGVFNLFDF